MILPKVVSNEPSAAATPSRFMPSTRSLRSFSTPSSASDASLKLLDFSILAGAGGGGALPLGGTPPNLLEGAAFEWGTLAWAVGTKVFGGAVEWVAAAVWVPRLPPKAFMADAIWLGPPPRSAFFS